MASAMAVVFSSERLTMTIKLCCQGTVLFQKFSGPLPHQPPSDRFPSRDLEIFRIFRA